MTRLRAWAMILRAIVPALRATMARGQGLAEYALILAFIAIVAILALMFIGADVRTLLSNVGKSV